MTKFSIVARHGAVAIASALMIVVQASALMADPLNSPVWADLSKKLFGDAPVTFDDRVVVIVPPVVENQAQVPITADARALPNVQKLMIITDLNPIQKVLVLTPEPGKTEPYIDVRVKVEQGTPVRAAALTSDGVWHVGGVFLDAAGGGCSSPAMARNDSSWADTVGDTQGRIWRELDGTSRLRMRIRHPMDTGLARDNTPAYYIDELDVRDGADAPLGKLELFEPVSEDPTMTLRVRVSPAKGVILNGRDNNGMQMRSVITAPLG